MTLLDAALAWHHGGCSVVPVRHDGTKAPALTAWRDYITTPADTDQITQWFTTDQHQGVGIICGAVSGNLEMLELEGRAITEGILLTFRQTLDDHGLTDLWNTLMAGYTELSPSGGIHWLYRVDGTARKNMKLARRPSTTAELETNPRNKIQVLIETRGAGGFVVVAPTPGSCHSSGKPWATVTGTPDTIPTISEELRDQLHAVASLLDTMPTADPDPGPGPGPQSGAPGYQPGNRPGDDYNAKANWDDILGTQGWTRMWKMGAGYGWRRPGKNDRSISATTGTSADGADRLYVFSSSTDFDTETPYSKFAAYTHLEHSGDYKAAAKALAAQGYGDPPTQSAPAIDIGHSSRHLRSVQPPPTDGTAAIAINPAPAAGTTLRQSDNGNAMALIDLHGQHIRYCPDLGRWLTWDGTRWHQTPSGGGYTRELVKDVAHRMPAGSTAADSWQKRSLSAIGISNTLTQAATDPRITIPLQALDADPWALGTPTGTVDLRTGTITLPNPEQLLTRSTAVTPDPDADITMWLQFLRTTFGGDQELIDYMQRLVGYSATGHIGPHVLPFAHGSGGNGKGVFLEAITGVLSDYATTAPNAFLMARNYSPHETEIARLAGARMVLCSEVNETDKFDEAKVKQLTGGDTLTARFMRQDHFTFTPSHHLWLMGNYRPSVTSGGRSFWRRCRLIPFLHEVPEEQQVDDLQGTLIHEHGPAILAWIIKGAVEYANGGLREPASVVQATAEYAHDQDTVARFVEEACHRATSQSGVRVTTRDLCTAYDRWCADGGEAPVTAKRLGQELRQRFDVAVERSNGKKFYAGIALISDRDDEQSGTAQSDDGWYR